MDCSDSKCECPCCVHLREVLHFNQFIRRMTVNDCNMVHDRILVPFLRNLNVLIPSLFPLEWISRPSSVSLLPMMKETSDDGLSLRNEYFRMCLLVHNWREYYMSSDVKLYDASGILSSFHCKGESLLCWLTERRRWKWVIEKRMVYSEDFSSVGVLVFRMRMQIKQINGVDVVYSRVYSELVAVLGALRPPLSMTAMCQFARDVGEVDRMRELATDFQRKFIVSHSFRVARYMASLVEALDAVLDDENQRLIAVAMSLHQRLGVLSMLGCLGNDVLPRCVHRGICSPLHGFFPLLEITDVRTVG